jgi:phosphoserine aminotransferase
VHICANETIGGVEYHFTPDTGAVPLVADMSSNILSRPVDVAKYGLIYGGAQKNIGPAGLTIVIVRADLIGQAHPLTPSAFDYKQQADNDSMLNTPPTYASTSPGSSSAGSRSAAGWRRWPSTTAPRPRCCTTPRRQRVLQQPGRARRSLADERAVPARDEALDDAFLKGAAARGMVQLKGHRSVGGMRASIYNAMPIEGVQALVDYMKEFEAEHG